ncbi:MAG: sulfotransferase [Phycisphaerales bacterium]|nr:MAG: sulfotransferase [Phycisphaerales bacterium]
MLPGRPGPRTNRNDPCPCGSGKKYKNCCRGKAQAGPAAASGAAPRLGYRELLRRADSEVKAGQLDQAQQLYRAALQRRPKDTIALFNLARVMEKLREFEEAAALIRRAIAVDGRNAEYHVGLATLLNRLGQSDAALRSAQRALSLDRKNIRAHTIVAEIHDRMNRLDQALASARKATAINPDSIDAGLVLGSLQRRTGELHEARITLERVIERDTDLERRSRALKELGLALDAMGEYDAAFQTFARGGEERAKTHAARGIDRDLWFDCVANYRNSITPELLARWTPEALGEAVPPPAFLVGFPRSGTTMTEQILAAHPSIATIDERPLILDLLLEIADRFSCGAREVPNVLARLELDDLRNLRDTYQRRVAEDLASDAAGQVIVDKMPLNIMHLGLINLLFPEARVIVALRDPRDVCLSCFMQRFGLNPAMVNFLSWERIGWLYAAVMGLWLHLEDVISLRHIQVKYEDTVVDLPTQARRVTDLLGVEWDERVLQFYEQAKERFVSTPSFAAVTEAVHTRAVGRWRNYERYLEPVLEHLQPFIDAFGYE